MRPVSSLLLTVLAVLLLTACGGGGSGAAPSGNFKVLITDSPFPLDYVESASIVIEEIQARNAETEQWATVFTGSLEIDLVPLTGGISQVVAEVDVEPGSYDQVRVFVGAGQVVLCDEAFVTGDTHVFSIENEGLFFPGVEEHGIVVVIDPPILVSDVVTGDLTLDFDLEKNFVLNGPIDREPGVSHITFTPEIRAVNTTESATVTVTVYTDNGTPDDVTDDVPLEGAEVTAFPQEVQKIGGGSTECHPQEGGSYTGPDGVTTISLRPGTYAILVEALRHQSVDEGGVQAIAGQETDVGIFLLPATGAEITGVVMSDGGTPDDPEDDVVIKNAAVLASLPGAPEEIVADPRTNKHGIYRVLELPAGLYDLTFLAEGFEAVERLDVEASAAGTELDVTLPALLCTLAGGAYDETETPIAGVTVKVKNAAGVEVATATTGAEGGFSVTLATGWYVVKFLNPETEAQTCREVRVVGGEDGCAPEVHVIL